MAPPRISPPLAASTEAALPAPPLSAAAEAAPPSSWLEGRLLLGEILLLGYATELAADIEATARLELAGVARCLEPLSPRFPTHCARATLVWSREQPLHRDGQHHTSDERSLRFDGLDDPQLRSCLAPLRESWQWAAGSSPRPPTFGFSIQLILADSAETAAACRQSP